MSIYVLMNEENVVYVYNEYHLFLQGNSVICYKNMDNLTKWNKPVTEGQILHDGTFVSSRSRQTHRSRRRIVVARGWKWEFGGDAV